jgi:hypothetical protein
VNDAGPAASEVTRRQILAFGGACSLAAAAGVTATLAGASDARAQTPGGEADADRLRRLISVELLMSYCYENVLSGPLPGPRVRRVLLPLHAHEDAHVHALSRHLARLGGTPPPAPASVKEADRDLARRGVVGRLGQLQGAHDALHLLLAVEKVVVGAYFVALIKLDDLALVTLAAQIMASEAQHEALIGEALYHGDAQKAVPSGLVQGLQ